MILLLFVLGLFPALVRAQKLTGASITPSSVVGGTNATGTVKISSAAPSGGFSVSVSCPHSYIQVPTTVKVPSGATSVDFTVGTSQVYSKSSATVSCKAGSTTVSASITVTALASLAGASLNPTSVVGGFDTIGTVKLTAPAPSGGFAVNVACAHSFVQPPATVTVPEGQASYGFHIPTSQVFSSSTVTVTFSAGTVTLKPSLTVTPYPIQSIALDPDTVIGSASSTATITLGTRAPANGVVVNLASNSSVASVPSTVTIPASYLTGKFTVKTVAVGVTKTASISASGGSGQTQSQVLTITPAAVKSLTVSHNHLVPGESTTATVSLGAAAPSGGVQVILSQNPDYLTMPASVVVSAGSKSASFTATAGRPPQNERVVLTGATDGGSTSAPVALVIATGLAQGTWSTDGADNQATHRGLGSGANGKILWSTNLPNHIFGGNLGPPIVGPDDTIYFVDFTICAFDARTGSLKWQSLNQGYCSYLSLSQEGTLYAIKAVNNSPTQIVAFDSTSGVEKWVITGPTASGLCGIPTLGPDGSLYFLWQDEKTSHVSLCSVDGILGTFNWTHEVGTSILFGGGVPLHKPLFNNGIVYTAGGTQTHPSTIAIQADAGAFLWEHADTNLQMIGSNGDVYVGEHLHDTFGNASVLSALGAQTGSTLWQSGVPQGQKTALDAEGNILSYGGSILTKANPLGGSVMWEHTGLMSSGDFDCGPSVAADGTIYIFSKNADYAFSKDDKTLWKVQSGAGPSIGPSGILYYATGAALFAIASDNDPHHPNALVKP
ncbi:MAG TPA: PQQ-binding-like beta-propeller repeat protein [Fimbriimonas sp.]|nr:PQQ-binding-like beta-propeller repeat protein [Fimbriimonas sp.]